MKILLIILGLIIAFLFGAAVGSCDDADFFCRHDWEEATKRENKKGTYIGYVCKKCKGTRTACFNFDKE